MKLFDRFAKAAVKRLFGETYTYLPYLSRREKRVISETAAYLSVDFMACCLAKSQAIASLPVHVFQTNADDYGEKVKHPLAKLLARRWNDLTTAFEGWNWLIMERSVFGNAYVRVKWNARGEPVALFPMARKCNVQPVMHPESGRCFWNVQFADDFTQPGTYSPHEILVFKTPVSKTCGITGESLAKLAAEEVGLSIDLERFYSRLLDNGNHFPGYLETDEDLSNKEKLSVIESLKQQSGIQTAGSIRIFDKGLKYRQNPLTIADMSMIDMQTWVLQQCCRILGVPPAMVYENSRSTYSNVDAMQLQFAQTTLTNEARSIEQALQPVLDAMEQRFPDCYARFDLNGYMRGAYRDRMEGYRIGVYAGFYTRAEVRKWEELPPIDGLDEPLQPTAYYSLTDGKPVDPSATNDEQKGNQQ